MCMWQKIKSHFLIWWHCWFFSWLTYNLSVPRFISQPPGWILRCHCFPHCSPKNEQEEASIWWETMSFPIFHFDVMVWFFQLMHMKWPCHGWYLGPQTENKDSAADIPNKQVQQVHGSKKYIPLFALILQIWFFRVILTHWPCHS